MNKKKWTILSNHGHVFAYITEHPQTTTQRLAQITGLSIRAVQTIIDDLEEEGYLTRERVGRCNRYEVNPDKPMRHSLERKHPVGDVLLALGCKLENF